MSNEICTICKVMCNQDGSCECQPPKNTCDKCKNREDVDFCDCRVDEYFLDFSMYGASEEVLEANLDCPVCSEVHYGCDCGCGGDFYEDYPESWEKDISKCTIHGSNDT